MSVNLAPGPFGVGGQFFDLNGNQLNGGFIYTYASGTTTPQPTFTTNSTITPIPNSNPIVLSVDGMCPQEIWLTAGIAYRFYVTDSLGNQIYPYTMDDVTGINDFSQIPTGTEWIETGLTPTFVNTTSFTLPGNQTGNFAAKRRIRVQETAGTIYGFVTSSSFLSPSTTVNVTLDGGVNVDSGITDVAFGILNSVNPSIPQYIVAGAGAGVTYTNGIPTITAGGVLPTITATVGSNILTMGYAGGLLDFPSATIGSGAISSLTVPALTLATPNAGATLGSSNAVAYRYWLAVINNAGTPELAVMNTQLGSGQIAAVNESVLISTTILNAASTSAGVWYSAAARSNVVFRLIGYFEATEATAGTWATTPSVIRPYGIGNRKPGELVQYVRAFSTAVVSDATAMFFDNTIPQNTEGGQYLTKAIVPTSALNTLLVDADLSFAPNAAGVAMIALFQDSTANAISGRANSVGTANAIQLPIHHVMQAGTVASTTFNVRAGINGAAQNSMNAQTGGGAVGLFGGTSFSWLTLTEVMV
jgi:hypothetical protein